MPFMLAFFLIPIIEISLFITVGGAIGLVPTLLITFLTAVIGGSIFRHQGSEIFARGSQSLNKGQFPLQEIFDGFCISVAAVMLMTPGFFTDAMGFMLLVPQFRQTVREFAVRKFDIVSTGFDGKRNEQHHYTSNDIETDYEIIDETKKCDKDR